MVHNNRNRNQDKQQCHDVQIYFIDYRFQINDNITTMVYTL